MALRRYICCFLLAVLTITCKRDVGFDPQPPLQYGTYYWGEVDGRRNNVPMLNPRILATLYSNYPQQACDKDHFTIRIDEFDDSGCLRLLLSIKDVLRHVGESSRFQYKLLPERCQPQHNPHVALHLMNCDIYLGNYLVDSLKRSELTISAFDTVSREVRGSFKLHFKLNERPNQTVLKTPDSLYYEATFKTKLLPEGKQRYD